MNYSIEKIRSLSERPLQELLESAKNHDLENRLDYAFAACCNACITGVGLTPYDEQIKAAHALYNGKIIEMKTGEGKTISAVFAAFLHCLDDRKVHILTYNDYLVKRDYNWMKPIYDLLGIEISFIVEGSTREQRKLAYTRQVVYNTAKECGFDFLRDFVVDKPEDIMHKNFDCVIVDEADSILIDEARIPLVIAGSLPAKTDSELERAFEFVKTLGEKHYGISDEADNAYLTDKGIEAAEEFFALDDLYDEENHPLIADINECLKANFSLKENVNYIVKDNEIFIIDEFTGRAAKNRRYPGSLQNAVEIKHGIKVKVRGVVMGTVPLQFFFRQYDKIAGMTGTVFPSEEEFELLYGLKPENIPPHVPSNRIDHPTEIYFNKEIKYRELKAEIIRANQKGQPLLIGAESIEESEFLGEELTKAGINHTVLNAKNDEAEAEIIKNAGAFKAVTISANMAGRGVDILLGGHDLKTRDEVIKAGGLYAISTSMRESSRINLQLRGRTGRQGDIGETKVFTSLDDEIMQKHELNKLVPKHKLQNFTDDKITDKTILREVERIQRISEGDKLEERKQLLKFTVISEKHRDAIFKARKKFVTGETAPQFWQENSPDEFESAVQKFGEMAILELQRELILQVINEAWSDYLVYTSALREGIHLTRVGGKEPSDEFNMQSQRYYEDMEERVVADMATALEDLLEMDDMAQFTAELSRKNPENIYTYLQYESPDELVKKPILLQAVEGAKLIDEDDDDEELQQENGEKPQTKQGFFKRFFG
ncbi:MAG: preprotein translocase subunit SecA [Oscillospiraceae bacterium]|nr:preprotein translocase subunit SecA [Oscillospiraceae bacterium]